MLGMQPRWLSQSSVTSAIPSAGHRSSPVQLAGPTTRHRDYEPRGPSSWLQQVAARGRSCFINAFISQHTATLKQTSDVMSTVNSTTCVYFGRKESSQGKQQPGYCYPRRPLWFNRPLQTHWPGARIYASPHGLSTGFPCGCSLLGPRRSLLKTGQQDGCQPRLSHTPPGCFGS